MKVTKRPPWFDGAPEWEFHEVRRHYRPDDDVLTSEYLSEDLPLNEARQRRSQGEPLEYILGHCHVGPITVKSDARALVPRPETETLLRKFERHENKLPPGPVVDCGTGTGIIAGWVSERTDRSVLATERYGPALSLARENRSLHGWTYSLIMTDRFSGIDGSFASVIANLPYVFPDSERIHESVREYEPEEALYIPQDAADFYGGFLEQVHQVLKAEGEVWIEGSDRLFELLQCLVSDRGFFVMSVTEDNADRERFMRLRKK